MKKNYWYLAALAALSLAACTPQMNEDPNPDDGKQEEPKSTACKLTSFTVNVG